MVSRNNKTKKIVTYSNLQDYFYERLFVINEKSLYKISDEVIFYSSKVLNDFSISEKLFEIKEGKVTEKILGRKLLEVNFHEKEMQKEIFKDVGDTALFLCGYFSESINKKILSIKYYQNLGRSAYLNLNSIVPNYFGMTSFYKKISDSFYQLSSLIAKISQEDVTKISNAKSNLLLDKISESSIPFTTKKQ